MRQVFYAVKKRMQAERRAPWATKIVKVKGGYMAFENLVDYTTWKQQQ